MTLAASSSGANPTRSTTYTQTYATASTTVAAQTATNALTDNSGGTSGGDTIAAINQASVDTSAAQRTSTRDAIATIAERLNELRVDHQNTTQVLNQLLDDLQAIGMIR